MNTEVENIDFSPMIFLDKEKEKVQRLGYQKWKDNNYKGTLQIATGVGKTFIGIMAVLKNIGKKILIVVPKCDLQEQWITELKKNLNLTDNDIGRVGNGHNEYSKKIVIAVINSIREKILFSELLIMDEVHRYCSEENSKFLKKGMFNKILGLTATIEREDGLERFIYKYAKLLFTYEQKEAIENKILTKFVLKNIALDLTYDEEQEYKKLDIRIKDLFKFFDNDFNMVNSAIRCGNPMAAEIMQKIQIRRNLLLCSDNKISMCYNALKKENFPKTLIFCEYIDMAKKIIKNLKDNNICAMEYHSKLKKKEKIKMLEDFKNNVYTVMVAVKSLDEGTNIPDCSMGIITGGTGLRKQAIQRFGRILRTSDGKECAIIYQLYIPNTQDYQWMKKRTEELSKNAEKVMWF
jgi:superfamily II DNA or RNA helicase